MKKYINSVVYSTNRLFRIIGSYGITKTKQKDMNSIHKISESQTQRDPKILSIISYIEGIDKTLIPISNPSFDNIVKNIKSKRIKEYSINMIMKKKITEELSSELNKIVLKWQIKENLLNEDKLNDKILVLLEFPLKEVSKDKLNELKEYYSTNKTFKGFRLSIKQINYLLSLIEKDLN